MKVISNIEYIVNCANDHICKYRVYVLKEEANTSSLLSIPESAIASQALASTTVHVDNPLCVLEERDLSSIMVSTELENL